MTKFLIAGLGSIGRRHLRNLIALGETDIVLLRTHRSSMPAADLDGYAVETDLTFALKKHAPDAVIVSNPTAFHLDIAIPAAEAGCAILLEKPISHSLERLDQLQAAVERARARVLVGFQLRYHPCLTRARDLLRAGNLGRVQSSRVQFSEYLPSWHPWEDYRQGYAARADLGGGVLLTQCHCLDYLPWLIGEVESVWGTLGKLSELELDVEDTAELGLRLADGSLAQVHIDFSQQPPSHQVGISGSKGSVQCDLQTGLTRFFDAAAGEWAEYDLPSGWDRNTMFLEEMRHFLEVVKRRAEPACNLHDGMQVMRLISAVRESHQSGRRVTPGS